MRTSSFIVTVILALAAAPYSSAQLLPDRFGTWSKGFCPAKPDTTILAVETGQKDNVSCQFSSNGQNNVVVWAGSFLDPSSAYEVYTSSINPGMHATTVGTIAGADHDKLVILVGNIVVRVEPPQNISTGDMQQLVAAVRAHADHTPLPPVRAYLPRGFIDGTQRYARGPAGFRSAIAALERDEFAILANDAGFDSDAEAMFARYRRGKDEAVLLLLDYPTPQLAEQHLRHLELAITPAAKEAGTTIQRKGTLLSLVLKPSSAAYGDALHSAVNYETVITQNEPHQTITDPPILTAVAKIFIATFAFMVVAVVLGVAFGGVRLLTKVFFPGKVFDRPEQMDVLQLGLSGKRINSRDFY